MSFLSFCFSMRPQVLKSLPLPSFTCLTSAVMSLSDPVKHARQKQETQQDKSRKAMKKNVFLKNDSRIRITFTYLTTRERGGRENGLPLIYQTTGRAAFHAFSSDMSSTMPKYDSSRLTNGDQTCSQIKSDSLCD